jgi:hypothetical protein
MTSPQPMRLRRGGAKRGDHGSYLAPAANQAPPTESSVPAGPIGADNPRSGASSPGLQTLKPAGESTARAKAAYDARPKVTFRGIDEEIADKLKAIYKHQLHTPGGVEGWSEWGRTVLEEFVNQYEQVHGDMSGGQDVKLRAGRIAGT